MFTYCMVCAEHLTMPWGVCILVMCPNDYWVHRLGSHHGKYQDDDCFSPEKNIFGNRLSPCWGVGGVRGESLIYLCLFVRHSQHLVVYWSVTSIHPSLGGDSTRGDIALS